MDQESHETHVEVLVMRGFTPQEAEDYLAGLDSWAAGHPADDPAVMAALLEQHAADQA